ncbi:MAG: TolC family protein [Bacteroidetes bacterium]|nr:TolC family protein [Bacteroidota bacterium]
MNKLIITGLFAIMITMAYTQETITLEACRDSAIIHYPLTRQKALLDEKNELKIKNLNKSYLPSMAINGQVSYQSDVTKVPLQNLPISGIEPLDKDWYKFSLDVNQVIYDGGITKYQKEIEETNLDLDQQKIEIEHFNLKQKINSIYFTILLLRENTNVLQLHKATLEARLKEVESGIQNGIILASNGDVLKAEIITIEQALDDLKISMAAAISVLNDYTGMTLTEKTRFLQPEIKIPLDEFTLNRPEYNLMKIQQKKIDASKQLTHSHNLPKLSAFGQAGYGRPGFDMLKNEFTDYYMIGARLNWSFWDWNKSRKEREVLDLQNQIIDTQKETFTKNIHADLTNKKSEISKIEEKIKRDQELIRLREKISASASSQLKNGTITSSDYLTELNAESKARLDMQIHRIELLQAKTEYITTTGNL